MAKNRNKWLFLIVIFVLLANIILLFFNLSFLKQKKSEAKRERILISPRGRLEEPSDFYNKPCPDVEMYSTDGKKVALSDFSGEVIVIRFKRFHPQDIPYLIYQDHLYDCFI
jgi:hypothetical protein